MGEYCAVRDVRNALAPEGGSEQETANKLPDWQIEDAILEAEGIVDAHVLGRYSVTPVETEVINPDDPDETWVFFWAPAPIWGWTRDIAAYLATLTFRKGKDLEERDPIALRYLLCREMLIAVRDGKMQLPLPTPDADSYGVSAYNIYEGTLFGPEDFGLVPEGSRHPQVLWPYYDTVG